MFMEYLDDLDALEKYRQPLTKGTTVGFSGFGHDPNLKPVGKVEKITPTPGGGFMVSIRMLKSEGGKHKRNINMKHTLTVVACLVAIALVSVLSISGYNSYKAWAAKQSAKAAAASAAEKKASLAQQVYFNHELDLLKAQCGKDKAAYAALTPFQKSKTAAPTCNTNLVQ